VYECIRRLMQTGLNVFIFPGTDIGIAVNIFLSFVFIKVHTYFQPYIDDDEDFLSELSHWLILSQLQMTLLLSTGVINPTGAVGILFFAISCTLFVAVFIVIVSPAQKAAGEVVHFVIDYVVTQYDRIITVLSCKSSTVSVKTDNKKKESIKPDVESAPGDDDDASALSTTANTWDTKEAHSLVTDKLNLTPPREVRLSDFRVFENHLLGSGASVASAFSDADIKRQARQEALSVRAMLDTDDPAAGAAHAATVATAAVVEPLPTSFKAVGAVNPALFLDNLQNSVEKLLRASQARLAMRNTLKHGLLHGCDDEDRRAEQVEAEMFAIARGDSAAQKDVLHKVLRAARANASAKERLRSGDMTVERLLAQTRYYYSSARSGDVRGTQ
jgi:hypothetical protein